MGDGCSQKLASAKFLRLLLLILIPCICALILLLVILLTFVGECKRNKMPYFLLKGLELRLHSQVQMQLWTLKVYLSISTQQVNQPSYLMFVAEK